VWTLEGKRRRKKGDEGGKRGGTRLGLEVSESKQKKKSGYPPFREENSQKEGERTGRQGGSKVHRGGQKNREKELFIPTPLQFQACIQGRGQETQTNPDIVVKRTQGGNCAAFPRLSFLLLPR